MSKQQYEPSKEELQLQARFTLEGSIHLWTVPDKMKYLWYLDKRAGLPLGTIGRIETEQNKNVNGQWIKTVKEIPYATKETAYILADLYEVSLEQRKEDITASYARYTYRATKSTGRYVDAVGACALTKSKGLVPMEDQERENKILHAETKAKRRATLEVCGLAYLDETEAKDVEGMKELPKLEEPTAVDAKPPSAPSSAATPGANASTSPAAATSEAPKPPAGTPKVESVTIVEAPPVVALAFEPPARYKDQAALFQGEPGSIELLAERITLILAEGKDKTGWGGQALSSWLNEAFGITMKNKGETLTVDKFREIMAIIDKALTEAGK